MSSKARISIAMLASALVGAGLTLTTGVFAVKETTNDTLPLKDLQAFVEILNRVKSDYVEPVQDDKLLENAVRGMLAGLDPHSSYLDKEEFKEMNTATTGKFGGLGIEVQMKDGLVFVVSPIDDTPAFKAGVQAGDYIAKINDDPVRGLSLKEAVDKMRGTPGTKIKITVVREGAPKPLDFKYASPRLASERGSRSYPLPSDGSTTSQVKISVGSSVNGSMRCESGSGISSMSEA